MTGVHTYSSIVLLQHLYVWVVGQASLADGREVGGFPAGPVEVLLDLRGHRRIQGWETRFFARNRTLNTARRNVLDGCGQDWQRLGAVEGAER